MKRFEIQPDWLQKVFPQGLPIPSSTVLTGPSEAGKPIIALGFVSSWLREGGSVIAAPLQFPNPKWASENLRALYTVKTKDHKEQLAHIQFDHKIDSVEVVNRNQIKANLTKPENWDLVINKAKKIVRESELGLMFFSTALNLPLFSPTYGNKLMSKIQEMFKANELTYLFCISTSMLKGKAEEIGEMAENLIEAFISENPKRLRFEVRRTIDVEPSGSELKAPFSEKTLEEAKRRAKKFRVTQVKKMKEI